MVSREGSTAASSTSAGQAGTVAAGAERAAVAVLARMLPAGFRDRQRAEWTADLLEVAVRGRVAQWRYLFAAAWTLPTLRSFARKGAAAGAGGLRDVVAAPAGLRLIARTLVASVAVPALCVAVSMVLSQDFVRLPQVLRAWDEIPLQVLYLALRIPALAIWYGGAALVAWLALIVMVLGPLQRGLRAGRRVAAGLAGLATVAALVVITFWLNQYPGGRLHSALDWLVNADGDTGAMTGLVGAASVALSVRGRTLSRRIRIALTVAGIAALTLTVLHYSPADAWINLQLQD
ncbi:hypothetical protein AB0368_17325 [Actinoplanes sp. NPDC051475]|uniref:hypothetical protein n=1 Tax=Actinoplanes sp. NPDC051475 TaxID=3157225 RepID=UPI00344B2E71